MLFLHYSDSQNTWYYDLFFDWITRPREAIGRMPQRIAVLESLAIIMHREPIHHY